MSDDRRLESSAPEEPEPGQDTEVLGRIGFEERPPTPLDRRRRPRRRRRLSGPGCALLFVAGMLAGLSAGLLFLGRRAGREPPPPPQPSDEEASLPADLGPAPPTIVFSAGDTRPDETPPVLEAGGELVFCFFDAPGAPPAADVAARWHHTGEPTEADAELHRDEGDHLAGYLLLKPPDGAARFAEGIYEVQLVVDGAPLTESSFLMTKGAAKLANVPREMERYRPEVTNLTVSAGEQRPRAAPFVLPARPAKVLVRFRYAHAVPGTAFTVNWLYEDGLIAQATSEVDIPAEAGNAEAWFAPQAPDILPVGKYGVLVTVSEGTPPLAKADFWVGRRPRADELTGSRR